MTKPRAMFSPPLSLGLLLFVCLSSISLHAQQSRATIDERVRGIDLYLQGNDQEAIRVLREVLKQDKEVISAWHYLGLAYNRQGKVKEALKAHEKAVKAGEDLLTSIFEIDASEQNTRARLAQLKQQFGEASASADEYLLMIAKSSSKKQAEWRERAKFLREMSLSYAPGEPTGDKIYSMNEVTVKARILSRAEPFYTETARANGTRGRVVLKLVLGVDGKVRIHRVVKSLPDGLTVEAIRAAHRIKFVPALKDGQPVSQLVQVEYGFNIY